MEIIETTPSEYIASLDEGIRADMEQLDAVISAAMPGRSKVVWQGTFWGGSEQTIIGYGHIVQPRPKGEDVEWFLVGLARQKRNYSIYLNAVRDDRYLAHHYEDRLGKVKLGSASIGFTKVDNVDFDVLSEMLAEADGLTPPDQRS